MKHIQLVGGVYIAPSGTTNLYDYFTEQDTGQDLTAQAFDDTATYYIPIKPTVRRFTLKRIVVGYVDGANQDDLSNIHFFEGSSATDWIQQAKWITSTGAIGETPTTGAPDETNLDPGILVNLEDDGKLYFITEWGTAVISCGAGEHFFIKVYGHVETGHGSKP